MSWDCWHISWTLWNLLLMQMKLKGPNLGLKDFRPIKPLGCGDTGRCAFFLVSFPMMYIYVYWAYFSFATLSVISFDVFLLICTFISLISNWRCDLGVIFWQNSNDNFSFFLKFSVHLVELRGSDEVFAMKAMDKSVMLNRNKVFSDLSELILPWCLCMPSSPRECHHLGASSFRSFIIYDSLFWMLVFSSNIQQFECGYWVALQVHRARAERDILALMDHPFLPTLYSSFQVFSSILLTSHMTLIHWYTDTSKHVGVAYIATTQL